jgi:hypothetical protein
MCVHSDVPMVTSFTEILRIFRGNGLSKSTRFPEGLVLGNWIKIFHPRNVGIGEFVKKFVNRWWPRGKEKCSWTISIISYKICWLTDIMRTNRWTSIGLQVCSMFQVSKDLANSGNCETGNIGELGEPLSDWGFGNLIQRFQKLATFANEDSEVKKDQVKGAASKVWVRGVN